jgi:DNA-binding IclR family transcriptional regulator
MKQDRVVSARSRRTTRAGDDVSASDSTASYTALKGVGRAIEVLEALAERPMRAKDLAEALGLKWTTAYRSLAYLEEQEYLRRDPSSGEYSIGPRLYVLGLAYLITDPLAPVAPAHLKAASERMGCAAQANEREGVRVMTVASVDSPTPIRKTSPGFTFPLGVAAKGKLLLAYAPEDVQRSVLSDPLTEFTRFTVTEPGALAAELEQIRAEGHAVTREDLQLGVGSVATPVRDRSGAVVGCVSLVVRNDRMNDARLVADLLATSEDASHEISVALGWRPAAAPA